MLTIEGQTSESLDADAIRGQLSQILGSRIFSTSPRMVSFLRFTVESTLQGDLDSLKETCIGVAVFDREPTYDPREDGIVRVEARRLRQKLQAYYETDGLHDQLVIDLPRGAYRPTFTLREQPPLVSAGSESEHFVMMPLLTEIVTEVRSAPDEGGLEHPRHRGVILRSILYIALIVTVVSGAIWGGHKFYRTRNEISPPVRSLTTFIGQEMEPTLSPDDQRFAFVWDGDKGSYNVYVRDLNNGPPQVLSKDTGLNLYPAWSPDGRDIAYVNISPDSLHILLSPSGGGAERTVSEFRPTASPWHKDARQITAQWSVGWTPDGRNLVTNISHSNEGKDRLALFLVSLYGSSEKQITFPPAGASDFEPAVSPDGREVAFFRATSKETGDLWLMQLSSGQERQLTSYKQDIRGITWTPDSRNVCFSSNHTGLYRIQALAIESGEQTELPTTGWDATDPVVTHDGKHLLYTDSQTNSNIWQQMLDEPAAESRPERLISSSMSSHSPRFSADGKFIAFASNRSGHWEIWFADANGANATQLTNFAGPLVDAPHWSPDDKQIVFEARPDGRAALFAISIADRKVLRLTDGSFNAKMPLWSNNGRWIYFDSDVNGVTQIWRMSPDGTGKVLLTTHPGYDIVESKTEPYLYFLSGDQYLYRVSNNGGAATRIDSIGRIGLSRYLDASDDSLYFLIDSTEPYPIERFNLRTLRMTRVAMLDGQIVSSTPSLAISASGNRLLYALQEVGTGDIRIMTFPRLDH